MKTIIKFAILLVLASGSSLYGQKPPLSHSVYDSWESLGQSVISDNGTWAACPVNPQQGDGLLWLFNLQSGARDSVPRGNAPAFSPESRYVAYQVQPAYEDVRQAKKKKLKEDQMPKNSLEIRVLSDGRKVKAERVKSFAIPAEGSQWMAYLHEKALPEKNNADSAGAKPELKEAGKKKPEPKGTDFVIVNPLLNREYTFTDVTEYSVAKYGRTISFIQEFPDTNKTSHFRITVFDTGREETSVVFEDYGSARKIACNNSGELVSFIFSDDTSKVKVYSLLLSRNMDKAVTAADTASAGMPEGWSVSENSSFVYSDDGKRLFFGTAPKPVREPADTLLDEEKYKVDIWSWNDRLLQPMQKKRLEQELKRTYQAVYHTDRNIMVQLADTSMPSMRLDPKSSSPVLLGSSDVKYQKLSSWESENYTDYFVVNLENGSRTKILEKHPSMVMMSPSGKYVAVWSQAARKYHILSPTGKIIKETDIPGSYPLFNELHDTPDDPSPYGIVGWTSDDRDFVFYDRYDIWSLRIEGNEAPVNVTGGYGRSNNLRLRYVKTDPDLVYIPLKESIILSAFSEATRESGFYSVQLLRDKPPVRLLMEKAFYPENVRKPKSGNRLVWQKESFDLSPELYAGNMDFSKPVRLLNTNPQQEKYNWLSAELFEWTSFDGQKLQGILYKPEDFDPEEKYPMIVYFYERSSDGLYRYNPPAPSASIINRSFAVSNRYLLFVPDIPYRIGYPGESCYNSVVSGTLALLGKYPWIDRERLGLDGQSWGGYQIAWLVTRTDLFRCAYSGAPVSNMISAYGGIRWESGMSRMFQYEETQSRIGGTLWEKPLLYMENSPIFYIPKINTPLLIMHNDADGAVPWYQGIEFINALRRLGKPAWMLSYNDEAHNLVKRPNRKDLSIRKMQFFDHYLKDAPVPYWMKYGITQTEKGKKDGYDLVEN